VILIDGGVGQLHSALDAFAEFETKPPFVVSLAKKEELIYVQRESEPIRLGRENLGLKMCQAIRDEAHRFAQHYHHLLVRKRLLPDAQTVRKGKPQLKPTVKPKLKPAAKPQSQSKRKPNA